MILLSAQKLQAPQRKRKEISTAGCGKWRVSIPEAWSSLSLHFSPDIWCVHACVCVNKIHLILIYLFILFYFGFYNPSLFILINCAVTQILQASLPNLIFYSSISSKIQAQCLSREALVNVNIVYLIFSLHRPPQNYPMCCAIACWAKRRESGQYWFNNNNAMPKYSAANL